MRALAVILSLLSLVGSLAIALPAPTRWLLPLGVAGPELSPWLVLFNVLGLVIAGLGFRPALLVFVIGLFVSLRPISQIPVVEGSITSQFSVHPQNTFLKSLYRPDLPSIEPEVLALNMRLYRFGESAKPRPILINIYGGAWQRGEPTDDRRFAQYMAAKGYAVFAIDYRHAPAAVFPAQVEDVNTAIAFIREHAVEYGADADRMALCGRSSGGQLALLAAYQKPASYIKAVIGFYPPTDLEQGFFDVPSPDPLRVRSILLTYLGGTPTQIPDTYRAASPVTYAGRPQPPTLLLQGGRDHIVKPQFARELFDKLKAGGTRAYLVELPWSEHAFDAELLGPGTVLALAAIEPFLQQAMIQ